MLSWLSAFYLFQIGVDAINGVDLLIYDMSLHNKTNEMDKPSSSVSCRWLLEGHYLQVVSVPLSVVVV